MYTHIKKFSAVMVAALALTGAVGCKCPGSSQPAVLPPPASLARGPMAIAAPSIFILVQPVSKLTPDGGDVEFSVGVVGATTNVTYEWEYNKDPIVYQTGVLVTTNAMQRHQKQQYLDQGFAPHPQSTNSPKFKLHHVSKADVAFYRVRITGGGGQVVVSEPAQLWVWKPGSIIVYGTVVTELGNGGGCPGSYNKRVDYSGVYPALFGPYKAKDVKQAGTWIEWFDSNWVPGCGAGQETTVSPVNNTLYYWFTIYIPSNLSAPSPYQIYLTNFYSP